MNVMSKQHISQLFPNLDALIKIHGENFQCSSRLLLDVSTVQYSSPDSINNTFNLFTPDHLLKWKRIKVHFHCEKYMHFSVMMSALSFLQTTELEFYSPLLRLMTIISKWKVNFRFWQTSSFKVLFLGECVFSFLQKEHLFQEMDNWQNSLKKYAFFALEK